MYRCLIKIISLISLCCLAFSSFSQDTKIVELINQGEFQQAIDKMCIGNDISDMDVQSLTSLAYCYVMQYDYQNAEKAYSEIVSRNRFEDNIHLYYGEVLLINKKYSLAKQSFQNFVDKVPDSYVGKVRLASCDSIKNWDKQPTEYKFSNFKTINTEFDEKSVCLINEWLVFVSNVVDEINRSNPNLKSNKVYSYKHYSGKLINFLPELLKEYSCDALDYCHEKNMLAVTLRKKADYLYNTELSVAEIYLIKLDKPEELVKFEWKRMPKDINTAHPAFSDDGNRLYFVSDMKGGIGLNDIWYSDFVESKWQKPVNAGVNINTKGNDLYPVVYGDSLFYSTDGLPGYGNLDMFLSVNFSKSKNLGNPLNSSGNDYSFHILNSHEGYFSSNRSTASQGMNDVFKWYIEQPVVVEEPIDTVVEEEKPIVFNPDNFMMIPVFFKTDSYEIEKGYIPYLNQIVDTLKLYPDVKLAVSGFADLRGRKAYSKEIAEKRALSVKEYFNSQGIDNSRVVISQAAISDDRPMAGLKYHVQVGYSKKSDAKQWYESKLKMPVKTFQVGEYTAYVVGEFDSKDQANQLRKEIENTLQGVVIASSNGRRLADLSFAINRRVDLLLSVGQK